MSRALLAACVTILVLTGALNRCSSVAAQQSAFRPEMLSTARSQYVSVAFHDVVDPGGRGDTGAVTAANLVSFFEWLHANRWTAITLDDIEQARSGARPLPDRAILITFDDGYESLYTRVYPLLLTYKIPVVAALVGRWMEGPKRETATVGGNLIPGTDTLITWDEARGMARSGLVEFASHTYDLHHTLPANPWRGQEPAGVTRAFRVAGGYESEEEYRRRIRADLEHSRALMQKELGQAPRALVWPFGRYNAIGEQEALAAKFVFLVTMDPEPGFPEDLPRVPRLLPVRDPNLPTMVTKVVPDPSGAVRLVRLDPGTLHPTDPAAFDKALGAAIERVRVLGSTTVVVDAATCGPQNRLETAWFPNRVVPVKADVLSRIVWQMHSRGHVDVAVLLPFAAARATAGDDAALLGLFADLGTNTLADALFIDEAPALASIPVDRSSSASQWEVRRRRNAVDLSRLPTPDALALRAFFAFENERPEDRLFLLAASAGEAPSAVADLTLIEAPLGAKPFRQLVNRLSAAGWFAPELRYRYGVWIQAAEPPSAAALSANVRLFGRRGGVAFGWEPDDPGRDEPKAAKAAPSVSAATFPLLRRP